MPLVAWEEVSKSFGGPPALDRVSLSVDQGEILAILGPSGSGKSTFLRLTAGLETLDAGRIVCQGRDISQDPPHKRDFGLMFQDYCLFPHLGVARNVAFGLRMRRWPAEKRAQRTMEMLRLVQMESFAGRSVLTLSGGEQQRVALARSLAPSPRLLMLDEPLGALDAVLRAELLGELGRILRAVGATAVYVTHDHGEAMSVASRLAILNAGRVEQAGTPLDLVQDPANRFVAAFLGLGSLLPAVPRRSAGRWFMRTDVGDVPVEGRDAFAPADTAGKSGWCLLVRPSAVRFSAAVGLSRTAALILGYGTTAAGVTVRLSLCGRDDHSFALECPLPAGAAASAAGLPGEMRSVWLDPAACAAVPA
jgi:thiamine transport system ATP-binding protein